MAKRTPSKVLLPLLLLLPFALLMGCGEDDEGEEMDRRMELIVQTVQAQERTDQLQTEAERLKGEAVSREYELSDMQGRLSEAQANKEAAEQDFMVAAVVAFASALAALVLAEALFRERRSRTVLARFLRWLSRRNGP